MAKLLCSPSVRDTTLESGARLPDSWALEPRLQLQQCGSVSCVISPVGCFIFQLLILLTEAENLLLGVAVSGEQQFGALFSAQFVPNLGLGV